MIASHDLVDNAGAGFTPPVARPALPFRGVSMAITLSDETCMRLLASIKRYSAENMEDEMGGG